MNSTPHTGRPVPQGDDDPSAAGEGRPEPRAGHWHREYLPDGTERHWADHARAYVEPDEDRARLAEAIDAVTWYRLDEPVPTSHGLLLKEIATAAGLRPIGFGISGLPLEFPEPAYLDRDRIDLDPDLFETLSVVAIAAVFGPTVFLTYLLDRGDKAVPLALELRERPRSARRSLACDAGLDQLCRGHFYRGHERHRCRCRCHGVATVIAGAA